MQLKPVERLRNNDDGLIPMINVVFLLLVFFMVAGTIKPKSPIEIDSPESSLTQESKAQRVLFLAADGAMALDGETVVAEELADILIKGKALDPAESSDDATEPSASLLQDQKIINQDIAKTEETKLPLGLKADASVTIKQLREVMGVLRAAGVREVELLTHWVPAADG